MAACHLPSSRAGLCRISPALQPPVGCTDWLLGPAVGAGQTGRGPLLTLQSLLNITPPAPPLPGQGEKCLGHGAQMRPGDPGRREGHDGLVLGPLSASWRPGRGGSRESPGPGLRDSEEAERAWRGQCRLHLGRGCWGPRHFHNHKGAAWTASPLWLPPGSSQPASLRPRAPRCCS